MGLILCENISYFIKNDEADKNLPCYFDVQKRRFLYTDEKPEEVFVAVPRFDLAEIYCDYAEISGLTHLLPPYDGYIIHRMEHVKKLVAEFADGHTDYLQEYVFLTLVSKIIDWAYENHIQFDEYNFDINDERNIRGLPTAFRIGE